MTRVLVVDDERDFRDQIRLTLEVEGCEVASAANCLEAVRMVPRYRPDILVADWMLRDHLHGLHVSEVLSTVRPGMRTVLMTGYATEDLRAEASGHRVAVFLEKPFEPARLIDAVREAKNLPAAHHPPVGVLQLRADGTIAWANDHARELFDRSGADAEPDRLDEVLDAQEVARLTPAPTRWLAVDSPAKRGPGASGSVSNVPGGSWHFLGKDLEGGGSLLVVLDDARLPVLRDHPVVQSLLGFEESGSMRWNLPGHVLLVDDEEYVRRFVAAQFQRAGCPCLTAECGEVALRLFARDEQIRYVLLDWYMPGDDAAELAREFLRIRPNVIIVGVSGEDRREDFARVGIDRFLAKPVRIESLIAELRAAEAAAAGTSSGSRGGVVRDGEPRDEGEWGRRLRELAKEFDVFMQRRPGARATRAMTVVDVLCDAWPRAMTVQEIVDQLWTDPAGRMRRAAGSVRNALNTLARNFGEFNRAVSEPLHGVHCELWRSDDQDSRLCRYALRIQPVSESVEPDREMRDYLSCLPRPVLQSMYDFVKGTDRAISPGAEQACRDVGSDLTDPEFRDLVIQVVELSRG